MAGDVFNQFSFLGHVTCQDRNLLKGKYFLFQGKVPFCTNDSPLKKLKSEQLPSF